MDDCESYCQVSKTKSARSTYEDKDSEPDQSAEQTEEPSVGQNIDLIEGECGEELVKDLEAMGQFSSYDTDQDL